MSFFIENAVVEIINVSDISPDQYGKYDLTKAAITESSCFFEKTFKTLQTPVGGLKGTINKIDARLMVMDIELPQPTSIFFKLTKLNDVPVNPVEYYQVAYYDKASIFLSVYELSLERIEEP